MDFLLTKNFFDAPSLVVFKTEPDLFKMPSFLKYLSLSILYFASFLIAMLFVDTVTMQVYSPTENLQIIPVF